MKKELDYSKMTLEELKEIAQPLLNPELFVKNLLIDNPVIKNNKFIPGLINHVFYRGYLYCIYLTSNNKAVGIIEIKDDRIYAICVLPEYKNNGIATALLKDAKNYAGEIYGPFVPEMVNKVWKFYHEW